MKNKYPAPCYACGKQVPAGGGDFERHQGRWRVRHYACKEAAHKARAEFAQRQSQETPQ